MSYNVQERKRDISCSVCIAVWYTIHYWHRL